MEATGTLRCSSPTAAREGYTATCAALDSRSQKPPQPVDLGQVFEILQVVYERLYNLSNIGTGV